MKYIYLLKQSFFKPKSSVLVIALMLCFSFNKIHSQQVLVSSGNNISSSQGSVSYSVGQIFQETLTNTNGSIIQGIQFFFESSTLEVIDLETNINIATYPNPTSAFINIKIDNLNNEKISFEIYDILGKQLIKKQLKHNFTKINIEDLPNAVYLLKLNNSNNKIIKTLKIIKN